MRAALLQIVLLLPLMAPHGADAAELSYRTAPRSIVLGQTNRATITIRGLEGTGRARAAVNVGSVQRIETRGETVVVHYRTPTERFPQRLCLILWRAGSPRARVVRVPLFGQTLAPVKTRKESQVTLTVAGKVFGPKSSGPHGRVNIRVIVPPGTTEGRVQVIDAKGMETQKTVSIHLPTYNRLAVAVKPARADAKGQDYSLLVATSELGLTGLVLAVRRTSPDVSEPVAVALTLGPEGLWSATWRPEQPGRYLVTARIPAISALKTALLTWQPHGSEAPPAPIPVVQERPTRPSPGFFDRLGWDISLSAGLLHNTGELLSPRLSMEAGADHPAGGGRIGLRLLLGLAWDSQRVKGQQVEGQQGVEATPSSVVLLPLGLGLTYRLPLSFGLTPHLTAGPMLQLIRSSNEGPDTGKVTRTDAAFGVVGLLGATYRLGPGGLMVQAGYLWSQLDNEDIVLQAGGVVAELGYRLEL